MTKTTAIIGAGMAGIAAARALNRNGHKLALFDKSRGIGGRLATRRSDTWRFDHGCPHFLAKDDRFQGFLDDLKRADILSDWQAGGRIGQPGMSAAARAALGSLPVTGQAEITDIAQTPDGWRLSDRNGPIDAVDNGAYGAVILALPSPQIIPILARAGITVAALQKVIYAPCWTLMLGFESPLGLSAAVQHIADGPLEKIIDEGSKPDRAASVVVHASAAWSRQNLERDKADIADHMLQLFQAATGITTPPVFISAHRWRYANVEKSTAQPFIWDPARRLGLAGDWANGGKIDIGVEAAFLSGHDLATAMIHG